MGDFKRTRDGRFAPDRRSQAVAHPATRPASHPTNTFERACYEYRSLKSRKTNPPGYFRDGIFHLTERFDCCERVIKPTPSEPYVELLHGRSAEHISVKYGVPEANILLGREY